MAFQIGLSTRVAQAQVASLTAQLTRLGQAADQAGAKMQSRVGGSGGVQGLKRIEAAIKSVDMNLIRMGNSWTKAQTQGASATDKLNKRINVQKTRFKTASVAADQYGNALLTVSQKAAILRSGMLALGTHVGIFSATTLLAATATFGLVKALKAVVVIGSEFTRSLAHTSAIIGETRENLAGLTEQMFRLAETTKFTTTEVAEASTVLAKTGLKAAAVAEALPAVLDLAAIGSMDMARAADIAANSMFGFQLKARDLTMVVDTLAFAATNSNTTVQQLGNALSFAAPVAAATGAKFKDVVGLLTVMADSGVKASRAGTTLRRAFVNLINPSDEAATVLRDLNVQLRDGQGQMRSMVDIMRDFAEAGGNVQDLESIFGVRALPGMAAVWQDLAKEVAGADSKLKDIFARMDIEGHRSANRMREAMEKNLIDTWLKFTSVLSVKATRAFSLVEESLTNLVVSMTDFARESIDMETSLDKISIHLGLWPKLFQDAKRDVKGLGGALLTAGAFTEGFSEGVGDLLSFIGRTFKLLPINILTVFKGLSQAIANALGEIFNDFSRWKTQIEKSLENIKFFFASAWAAVKVTALKLLAPMFEWIQDKIRGLAKLLEVAGFDTLAGKLEGAAAALEGFASTDTIVASVQAELKERLKTIKLLDDELDRLDNVRKINAKIHSELMNNIQAERQGKLGAFQAELDHADRMGRIRERLSRDVRSGSRAPFRAPEPEVSKGRGILLEDKEGIMKGSIKDMKEFIKLQRVSIVNVKSQIETLLTLKLISPFDALRANITKAEVSLVELKEAYTPLVAELERFKKQANDTRHFDKAKEYQAQIDKVTVAMEIQAAVLERLASNGSNQLTVLQDKYELVADAVHGYVVQLRQLKDFSETQLINEVDALRNEGKSGMQKIREEQAQKMDILQQARETELTLQNEHNDRKLLSESEFQSMMLQIQIEAGKQRNEQLGGGLQDTFDLAESIRSKDLAGAMSSGIKMLDQAGKHSKKAFEASKKIKIAQAIIATYTGAAEAMKWGFPMGPIFAALMIAQGFQQVQAIRSTSFGGGSGGSGGGGGAVSSPSVPTVEIPPQTDAIFNQTNTGGVPNTIDTSGRGNLSVEFTINAVDAAGIDELLFERQPQIIGMIQEAYNERGASGGPVQ